MKALVCGDDFPSQVIGRLILTPSENVNGKMHVDKTLTQKRGMQRIYMETLNRENYEEEEELQYNSQITGI